jgi:hypothetical protein
MNHINHKIMETTKESFLWAVYAVIMLALGVVVYLMGTM